MSSTIYNKDNSFAVRSGTYYLESMEEYSISTTRVKLVWRESNSSCRTGLAFLQFVPQLREGEKRGKKFSCIKCFKTPGLLNYLKTGN